MTKPIDPIEPNDPATAFDRGQTDPEIDLEWNDDLWLERLRSADEGSQIQRLGRYELIEEIGRGGQGVVYRGRDTTAGQDVAIKRLLAGRLSSPPTQARFDREAEAVRGLDHPGIVQVLGVEAHNGHDLLIMEWIDGQPINHWAKAHPDVETIVGQIHKVALALLHAHRRGVIHRDIKPSNILVDSEGAPHLLDFGLAKQIHSISEGSHITTTGEFLGTLAYASPEQLLGSGSEIDARSDLYSLGVILYEMLTGLLPYSQQSSLPTMLRSILSAAPIPLRRRRPDLDGSIEAVLQKSLEKSPDDRYRSIDAFADDLDRYLRGEPVHAKAPGSAQILGRLVRKHPLASSVVATLVTLVIAFGITMTVLWSRTVRANERHERLQSVLETTLTRGWVPRGVDDETAADILADASEKIRADLQSEPEMEYFVRNRIAARYEKFGLYEDASREASRAKALQEELNEDLGEEYTLSLIRLGFAKVMLGEGDGMPLMLRSLAHHETLVDPTHRDLAGIHSKIAKALWALPPCDFAGAERHYRSAIEILETSEPDSIQTGARIWRDFGNFLCTLDRDAEAVSVFEKSLEAFALHEYPHGTIGCLEDLSKSLARLHRWPEAQVTLERAIELRDGTIDSSLPPTYAFLGNTYYYRDRFAEGLVYYHEAIAVRLRRLAQLYPSRKPQLHAAAARIRTQGLTPNDVEHLWVLFEQTEPWIVSAFQYTGGQIVATHESLGNEDLSRAIEAELLRMTRLREQSTAAAG